MIVDSNVLVDLIDGLLPEDVANQLIGLAARDELTVNEIIFAEISGRYETAEAVHDVLAALSIRIVGLSLDDCFRAGKAFREYRRRSGAREAILADFLIGAQAAQNGWSLLTRDRKGFASYFPEVELIDPLTAET